MMRRFLADQTTDAIAEGLTPFDEFNHFIGLSEMAELNRRYGT